MITATYRGRLDERKFCSLLGRGGVDVTYLDERARVRVLRVPSVGELRGYEITLTRGEVLPLVPKVSLADLDALVAT